MARARAAIWSAKTGSRPAGRLSPCRTALRDDRALPWGVFGPRLRRPLPAARFASGFTDHAGSDADLSSLFVLQQLKPTCKRNLTAEKKLRMAQPSVSRRLKSLSGEFRPDCIVFLA